MSLAQPYLTRLFLTALIPLLFPACKETGGQALLWETEREQIELAQRLKLAEYRLGLTSPDASSALGQLQSELRNSQQKIQDLRAGHAVLTAEVSGMELGIQEFCRTMIEGRRANSSGLKFESFSAKDGRVFKDVFVTGVDDAGVEIRHQHGAARLRYAELTAEQRLMFGLEEDAALAAEEIERREALAYERSIDNELEAQRAREQSTASLARNSYTQPRSARSQTAAPNMVRDSGPLSKPATPFGTGSIYRRSYDSYGSRSYRPTFRYVYYYPTTRNPYCSPRTYRSVVDNRIVPRIQY